MTVFNLQQNIEENKRNCFFDEPLAIARYDNPKYPIFSKLTKQQRGFFWQPEEVAIERDSKDFKSLTTHEQHIFTSNLKRQILLDSVQGRAPTAAFSPICSLPELEIWLQTWAFSETIHSDSYTHIIRNVYPDPSKVFDEIIKIQEIVDCATDISKYYDDLIKFNIDRENPHNAYDWNDCNYYNPEYAHKKALWLCLMSVNILEGVRFYVSFACSWAFAELKKMEGNAKIIKLICRDENLHLASTQHLLKILPKEDEDFAKIQKQTEQECINLFKSAADQEKAWAEYLFKDGSMIGLNTTLLNDYVEWITNKRLAAVGLPLQYKTGSNPLPWTERWISGKEVQVAPQETEITSYIIGGVKNDLNENVMKGFKL